MDLAMASARILVVLQEETAAIKVRDELLVVIGFLEIELLQFDVDCRFKPFRVMLVRQRPPHGLGYTKCGSENGDVALGLEAPQLELVVQVSVERHEAVLLGRVVGVRSR